PQISPWDHVEESAINLWNWAVTKHAGSVVNDEQRAKCMYVFYTFLNVCCVTIFSQSMYCFLLQMSMKTGKGWIDIGKADLADEFLEIAMSNIEKLYAKLLKGSDSEADIHVHKADVEKNVFKVLSYQAESAVAQGDFQKAVMCVQRCKDMLMKLPKETCYLSILCYNFGVETYEQKRYEQICFSFQAKVLRLLATAYFEWDCNRYLDKALKAISLANQVVMCYCICAVAEFLHHEMSLDFCLNTAKLLLEHGRESVGFDFLKSVPERFESSLDLGKFTVLHIEFLLQNKRELLAKQKVEEVIIGHYTGKQLLPEALNRLHIILWDTAAKHYEVCYSEALHWYNYSVSFYTPGQIDQNLAKLQRNMASCYLHLKQVDKAKEAVKEAERCDPNSIFTKFSIYKIAVMEKNTDKGIYTKHVFISFQNEQQVVAIKALEYLSEHVQDCQQLFAALKRPSNHLFMSKLLYMGRILITFSYFWCQLSQFCPSDKAVLIAQKTCLLMAAAIDLEMGRQQVTPSEQYMTQALQHVQACKEIWKVLKLTGDFAKDPTDTLLLLYEFEARSKLSDPTLYNLMESVWEQPQIEVKTLEIIASLAMESPARYPVLCKKALKSALSLHRKQAVIDAVKFSKCLHSLINLSLPTGLTDLDTCVLQEMWDYFEDALSVVSSTNAYPEMEILWLMTRAWNTGIFQYTVGKYKEAEQWCGLGMRFLNHLGSLKKTYEGHVSALPVYLNHLLYEYFQAWFLVESSVL
uniref:Protein ZIP4 homolog n=1 Tax=Athene cunicularia TaxID=194338 RepID=A0A663MIH8_ATHCN